MRDRTFGRTGWSVGEIGYGMWGLAGWTGSDDAESLASLERAVELGCNFFDTAWAYGAGHSERLLGRVVRAHPGRTLYVATKVPPKNITWPSRRGFALDDCFPPDHIREYAEKSLENLGLPRIDLLQFHVWEDAWARDDRWQRAMDDLKREGLVRAVGISVNRWEPWNVAGDPADRAGRRGAGDLQHLRPGPAGRALPALPGAEHRRDRPGAVRRGDADGDADPGDRAGRRATGGTPTSSPRTSRRASTGPRPCGRSCPRG